MLLALSLISFNSCLSNVQTVSYPKYDKKDGHSDLAILYLGEDVTFNGLIFNPLIRNGPIAHSVFFLLDAVSPICLPTSDPVRTRNLDWLNPFVAGWGRTQEGGKSATVLQELQLPVIPNTECRGLYSKMSKVFSDKQFDDAVLCAGVVEGGKDSCQGDSGGPLMFPQRSGNNFYFYQIGIVSYGIGCARAEVPGVYTRVTHFVDWIQEKVAEPV